MGDFHPSLRQIINNAYSETGKYLSVSDFLIEASLGNIPGASVEHKFGRNGAVGGTLEPISTDGIYRTPTVAVNLEAISTDANDTAAGTGAREITVEYLDSLFNLQSATLAMNGTTATTETITGVIRLLRAYVSESGTYASSVAGSHDGTITFRETGAGQAWGSIIIFSNFPLGQTLIGAYTVPAGKTAYILSANFSVDTNKTANLLFFKREGANIVTAPFSPMRVQNMYDVISGFSFFEHKGLEAYPEYTDMGFMASDGAGTELSIEFEMLILDN